MKVASLALLLLASCASTAPPGESAGFKAGVRDGHHLQNRSAADARLLVVGSRSDEDGGEYSDIDMMFTAGRYSGKGGYKRKDGTSY